MVNIGLLWCKMRVRQWSRAVIGDAMAGGIKWTEGDASAVLQLRILERQMMRI